MGRWCYRLGTMRITGPLYLILLGLLISAVGGVFLWLMWRSFDRAAHQRDWSEVPCRILQSEVVERRIGENVPVEYAHGLLYGYEREGKGQTSDRHTLRGASWSSSPAGAAELVEEYPVGSEQTCHVDPADPEMAVLKLDSKAPGYSLWFPLFLTVGGLGIVVGSAGKLLRGAGATPPQ